MSSTDPRASRSAQLIPKKLVVNCPTRDLNARSFVFTLLRRNRFPGLLGVRYLISVGKQYDPQALLYRWSFREDDNLPRLIGTDPSLADRSKFFRWINEPGGWAKREPWPHGPTNVEAVDNSAGLASGWPGAVPIRPKLGRPVKEVPEDDKLVATSVSIRRAELFKVQRLASDARQTVSEWVASVVRAEIDRLSNRAT